MEKEILAATKADMSKLLESGDHTDLTLRCEDGTVFRVHKAILAARSGFFAKAVNPAHFQESYSGVINLKVGDSQTIKRLMDFVYSQYDGRQTTPQAKVLASEHNEVLTAAELYVAADFYDIPSLKKLASRDFGFYAKHYLDCRGQHPNNVEVCLKAVEILYRPVNTSNEALHSDMRNTVCEVINGVSKSVVRSEEWKKLFTSSLARNSQLGKDLYCSVVAKDDPFNVYKCPNCATIWAMTATLAAAGSIWAACPKCFHKLSSWSIHVLKD